MRYDSGRRSPNDSCDAFFRQDPAAAGFFRDNIIIGAVILVALMAVANYALTHVFAYLAPERK